MFRAEINKTLFCHTHYDPSVSADFAMDFGKPLYWLLDLLLHAFFLCFDLPLFLGLLSCHVPPLSKCWIVPVSSTCVDSYGACKIWLESSSLCWKGPLKVIWSYPYAKLGHLWSQMRLFRVACKKILKAAFYLLKSILKLPFLGFVPVVVWTGSQTTLSRVTIVCTYCVQAAWAVWFFRLPVTEREGRAIV